MTKAGIWDSIKYYAKGLYNYVDEDHCFLLAAGIAFNVLYTLLPLSLVLFYVFSSALTSEKAVATVLDYVSQSFPLPVYQDELRGWIAKKFVGLNHESNIAGIVGGISLFWLASVLFSTLRTSVNAVFNMPQKTNAIYQKLYDFVLMIIILVLLLSSTIIDPIVSFIQHYGDQLIPAWIDNLMDSALPHFISLAISVTLYSLLFRMLPHERLSRKVIVVSAATSVFLTEAMRLLFSYYMQHASSIGTLYGTYAFLVGVSLWIYYASLAFLIGAEVGWLYKERHEIVAEPVLTASVAEAVKNPGLAAIEPAALEVYETVKTNPTRPAGEIKPPPPSAPL